MKTIERYVFGSFLSSFILSFLVLSFVLTVGLMVQVVAFILDGVPMGLVAEFTLLSFPETLQWTMPLALLVSSVLVFSRMSADNEIAAMRACGINLLSIMKWPVFFAIFCTALGIFVNNEVAPRGHEVRRTLASKVTVGVGLDILQAGRIIDEFPKVKFYFGSKEGNWLYDLIINDYSNPKFDRMITASKALVTSEGKDIHLDLYQMTVDPLDEDHPTAAHANRFSYVIKDALQGRRAYTRRDSDYTFFETLKRLDELKASLVKALNNPKTEETQRIFLKQEISNLRLEFSKRFVFAMASICFVLVGIPLGIKAQRRENTIGMAISLVISIGFYMIVMIAIGVEDYYWLRPDIIVWSAVAICFAIAAWLIPKHL